MSNSVLALKNLKQYAKDTVVPIIDSAKDDIIAGAPWILRGPLKISWNWMLTKLAPALLSFAIDALFHRYGAIIASMLQLLIPAITKIVVPDIVDLLRLVLTATQIPVENLDSHVTNLIMPLTSKEWQK